MSFNLSNITISIVAYNSAAVLPVCVESIPRECRVVVFDNASRDDGVILAQRQRPDIGILRSDVNIGFGNAHNRILQQVQTEFALVLNPDAILHADTLRLMLQAAQENPQAAIIGAAHIAHDGSVESSFRPFDPKITRVTEVEMISGAIMLLRMSAFNGVFFDPNIFLYFEDDDICVEAKKRGWKILVEPNAKITHSPGLSSGKPTWASLKRRAHHFAWSRCYFNDKLHGFDPTKANEFRRRIKRLIWKRLMVSAMTLKVSRMARFYGELRGTVAYGRGRLKSF